MPLPAAAAAAAAAATAVKHQQDSTVSSQFVVLLASDAELFVEVRPIFASLVHAFTRVLTFSQCDMYER